MLKNLFVGILAIVCIIIAIVLIPILAIAVHIAAWVLCLVGILALFIGGFIMLGWIIRNILRMLNRKP